MLNDFFRFSFYNNEVVFFNSLMWVFFRISILYQSCCLIVLQILAITLLSHISSWANNTKRTGFLGSQEKFHLSHHWTSNWNHSNPITGIESFLKKIHIYYVCALPELKQLCDDISKLSMLLLQWKYVGAYKRS